ncbi:hypothetical protein AB1Z15_004576 [Vibrio parahaemolyticus]
MGFFDFYNLKDAFNDVTDEPDTSGKMTKSATLVGKTLFNVGLAAGKVSIAMAKEVPGALLKKSERELKRTDISDNERQKWADIKSKAENLNDKIKEKQ